MSRVKVKRIVFGPGEPTSPIQWTLEHPELKQPDKPGPAQNGDEFTFDLNGTVDQAEIHLQTPPVKDGPDSGGSWVLRTTNDPDGSERPVINTKKNRSSTGGGGSVPPIVISSFSAVLTSDLSYHMTIEFGEFNGGMAPFDHSEVEGDSIVFYFRNEDGVPGTDDLDVDLSNFANQQVTFEARYVDETSGITIGSLKIQYI